MMAGRESWEQVQLKFTLSKMLSKTFQLIFFIFLFTDIVYFFIVYCFWPFLKAMLLYISLYVPKTCASDSILFFI